MKELLTRIKLRYHEGTGLSLTLAQADAVPKNTPLWVSCMPVREFNTEHTWRERMYDIKNYDYDSDDPGPRSRFTHNADLLITVPYHKDAGGWGMDHLKIFHAKVPQCLTERMPRQRILEAPDFRRLHKLGMFHILSSYAVRKIMASEDNQKLAAALADRMRLDRDPRSRVGG